MQPKRPSDWIVSHLYGAVVAAFAAAVALTPITTITFASQWPIEEAIQLVPMIAFVALPAGFVVFLVGVLLLGAPARWMAARAPKDHAWVAAVGGAILAMFAAAALLRFSIESAVWAALVAPPGAVAGVVYRRMMR